MALYRRTSRFIFDAFLRRNPKITALPKSLPTLLTSFHRSSPSSPSTSRISGLCQTLLRSFVSQHAIKNSQRYFKNPFLDGSKRLFFHRTNKALEHFKPRGFEQWVQNPRNLLRTGLLGCGSLSSVYYWNLERVPYTKRSHFMLMSTSLEKKMGGIYSKWTINSEYDGKVLPPLHPSSIRVRTIGKEIVEAAEKGLKEEDESMIIRIFKKLGKRDYHQIPNFEWEFLVVEEPIENALCYPGGKIVVYTGLLDACESDAEIAATLGHEVGHAIARHNAEGFFGLSLMDFLKWFLYENTSSYLAHTLSKFLIRLPYSRRTELEADHIGLMVMAAAGYDPRVAVEVWEREDQYESAKARPLGDYTSTHPCSEKRAQFLSQPQVMEEALSVYREALARSNAA